MRKIRLEVEVEPDAYAALEEMTDGEGTVEDALEALVSTELDDLVIERRCGGIFEKRLRLPKARAR